MKKGVTLIEVLVASLILVIGIGSSLMIIVQHKNLIKNVGLRSTASNIINYKFESFSGLSYSEIQTKTTSPTSSDFNFDEITLSDSANCEGIYIESTDGNKHNFYLCYKKEYVQTNGNAADAANPGTLQITAKVMWSSSGDLKTKQLTTRFKRVQN